MQLRTMTEVGAVVRSARRHHHLTQSQLAARMGVTQAWVSRLENGHPRLEAQLVLDALNVLDVPLTAGAQATPGNPSDGAAATGDADPFADVVSRVRP